MEMIFKERFNKRLEAERETNDLYLHFEGRSSGSLLVFVKEDAKQVSLHLDAQEYSYVKVFVGWQSRHEGVLNITGHVGRDAKVQLGILDLEASPLRTVLHGHLDETGAAMEVFTGQLCMENAPKNNEIKLVHHKEHTYGNMHNFAVVYDKGSYFTVADGTIAKGCWGSESHQETRVLTMGNGHKTQVIPILYIDENDVKASHALTIGQPDESQLYYLQSRGLSKAQAIGLLSIGYFMPVIDLVEDTDLHDALRQEMERRVGLYGH